MADIKSDNMDDSSDLSKLNQSDKLCLKCMLGQRKQPSSYNPHSFFISSNNHWNSMGARFYYYYKSDFNFTLAKF